MQTQIMLSVIDPYILLAIGILFIAFEAMLGSFVIIWFGIGFGITAFISNFYTFSDGIWQIATVSFISILLLLVFRKKILETILKSKIEVSDDFLNERGIGEIKNSKVFYKGTYWEVDSEIKTDNFEEGEKVVVLKTSKNNATIQKR